MTRRVISVRPDDALLDGAKIMLQDNIGGLPVVSKDKDLVGILTAGDFLRRAEVGTDRYPPQWPEFMVHPARLAEQFLHSHSRKVADVMTRDVVAIPEDCSIEAAVTLMERKKLKRLPVLDGRRVLGMLTRTDRLRAVAAVLGSNAHSQDDVSIQRQIHA